MKKLISILFLFVSFYSYSQDVAPNDTANHVLSTYSFSRRSVDSTLRIYEGKKWGWQKLLTLRDSSSYFFNIQQNSLSEIPIKGKNTILFSDSPSLSWGITSGTPNIIQGYGPISIINSYTLASSGFGSYAGTNANYSVFLGNGAGAGSGGSGTSSDYAVHIGNGAGALATQSLYSIFMGNMAGSYASAGYYMNAQGYQTGMHNPSQYSFLAGWNVAHYSPGVTGSVLTGTNDIIIGKNITLNGQSNAINLGGVIFATGTYNSTSGQPSYVGQSNGNMGVSIPNPTARLHLPGGTTAAGTASLKIASGYLLPTKEAGAIENDGNHIYYTDNSANRWPLDQQSAGIILTTNGTSGAANLRNDTLNIPVYGGSGGGINLTDLYGDNPILYNNTTGHFSHDTIDGHHHVPATGTGNLGKVLTAGGSAGSLYWNYPVLPVNADWNATSGLAQIYNKPTIPSAQVWPGAGIALSNGSTWLTSITDNSAKWNRAVVDTLRWSGTSTGLNAATGRTSLGGTTIGQNYFTLPNPGSVTYPQQNADNSITSLSASGLRTAIGAGTGTLSSIGLTMPTGFTVSNSPLTSNGTIGVALSSGYYLPTTTDQSTWNGKQNALGFTPYNSTNPAGYISANMLSATTPLHYNDTTGVFSIRPATTSQSGYLTQSDWNTFYLKQPQLNGTGLVRMSGTTVTYDNSSYVTGTPWLSMNYITLSSLSGTSPITYNSGTGTIGISQSGASTNGYLSSTDWNTFNNKVSLVYPASGLAKSNGSSWLPSITDNSIGWNRAVQDTMQWNGQSTGLNALNGRNSLGGTTVGQAFFMATNPNAVSYPQVSAINGVSFLSGSSLRTAIGAGIGNGTVTSVGLSMPTGFTVGSSPVIGSGTLGVTLSSGYAIPTTADTTKWTNKQNALGFTPYNATNPAGYIAANMLSATSPILYNSTTGVFKLDTTYHFVPSVGTTNNGKVLTAGGSAGSLYWTTPTSGISYPSGTGLVTVNSGVWGSTVGGSKTGQMLYYNGSNWVGSSSGLLNYKEASGIGFFKLDSAKIISGVVNDTVQTKIIGGNTGLQAYGASFWRSALQRKNAPSSLMRRPDISSIKGDYGSEFLIGRNAFTTDIVVGDGTGNTTDSGTGIANAYIRFPAYGMGTMVIDTTGYPGLIKSIPNGSSGKVWTSNGPTANPSWQTPSGGGGGISGTGTANYIPMWTSSTAQGNSNINVVGSSPLTLSTMRGGLGGSENLIFGTGGISFTGTGTQGDYNTAFGLQASQSITTGQLNTTLGYSAALILSTGTQNVVLGADAGNYLTSGNSNVFIGNATAQTADTNNSCTIIGANSNISASGTINETVIGAGAIGHGSNTAVIGNTNTERTFISGLTLPYISVSSTYNALATDDVINCTTGTFTVKLPTAVGTSGRMYHVKNSGTGTITVSTTSSQTIDGSTTYTLSTQWSKITFVSTGSNWITF